MKRSSRWAGICASIGLLALTIGGVSLIVTSRSSADVSVLMPNTACQPVNDPCPSCNGIPPALGCDAPIPAGWSAGSCRGPGVTCRQNNNKNCGNQLDCFNSNEETGLPCGTIVTCR